MIRPLFIHAGGRGSIFVIFFHVAPTYSSGHWVHIVKRGVLLRMAQDYIALLWFFCHSTNCEILRNDRRRRFIWSLLEMWGWNVFSSWAKHLPSVLGGKICNRARDNVASCMYTYHYVINWDESRNPYCCDNFSIQSPIPDVWYHWGNTKQDDYCHCKTSRIQCKQCASQLCSCESASRSALENLARRHSCYCWPGQLSRICCSICPSDRSTKNWFGNGNWGLNVCRTPSICKWNICARKYRVCKWNFCAGRYRTALKEPVKFIDEILYTCFDCFTYLQRPKESAQSIDKISNTCFDRFIFYFQQVKIQVISRTFLGHIACRWVLSWVPQWEEWFSFYLPHIYCGNSFHVPIKKRYI